MADTYEITSQTEVRRVDADAQVVNVMRVGFKALPSGATATVEVPVTDNYVADVQKAVADRADALNRAAGL